MSAHVAFLRGALGSAAVARPAIDIDSSFTAAAQAAGLIGPGETFDAYASDENVLLAAFIFEDVGVTAYKGAAPLMSNKTFWAPPGSWPVVECSLDGPGDQGIDINGAVNLVPADANGIAFGGTPQEVHNIVYLTPQAVASGGFFPAGTNGELTTSG